MYLLTGSKTNQLKQSTPNQKSTTPMNATVNRKILDPSPTTEKILVKKKAMSGTRRGNSKPDPTITPTHLEM